MKMTFRWYGENSDAVTLKQIKQIPGMSGVMGFLDYKAAGEVWTKEEIAAYIAHPGWLYRQLYRDHPQPGGVWREGDRVQFHARV